MQVIVSFKESGVRSVLDPRTALVAILVISMVMMCGGLSGVEYYLRIICWMIPFAFLLAMKNYKKAITYFCLYVFATVIEGAVLRITSGGVNLFFVIIAGMISRFLAPMIMGYCVMQSTTVSEFVTAMERMHVPQTITIPLAVMFRFFPTISEETRAVSEAMRMRQIAGKKQSIIKKMEYELVPVMMATVRIADELSQASLTKGLGGAIKRTHICEVGFRVRDYMLIALLVIVLLLFVVY